MRRSRRRSITLFGLPTTSTTGILEDMQFSSRLWHLGAVFLVLASSSARAGDQRTLWNIKGLERPPKVEWGERSNCVQALYYQGEPLNGRPTRVFEWLGRPEGKGPFPALALVHGGGGKAFADWAELWA